MEKNKTIQAITLLLEQTQEGTLKWKVSSPARDLIQGPNLIDVVYIAEKDQRLLRLYPYKFKYFVDEENWHWENEVALELSDSQKVAWWQFPKHPVTWDLLEAVQFKTVGADSFIENLLKEQKILQEDL